MLARYFTINLVLSHFPGLSYMLIINRCEPLRQLPQLCYLPKEHIKKKKKSLVNTEIKTQWAKGLCPSQGHTSQRQSVEGGKRVVSALFGRARWAVWRFGNEDSELSVLAGSATVLICNWLNPLRWKQQMTKASCQGLENLWFEFPCGSCSQSQADTEGWLYIL